jgi:hypothetical protein
MTNVKPILEDEGFANSGIDKGLRVDLCLGHV